MKITFKLFKKITLVYLAVAIALSAMGIAYGITASNITIMSDLPCSDPFTWTYTNDDGIINNPVYDPGDNGGGTEYDYWGAGSSNDPGSFPPPAFTPVPGVIWTMFDRYTKDVARTTSSIYPDPQQITVVVDNAYPYYYSTVFFALECPNSVRGNIQGIVLTGVPDELLVDYSGIYVGQEIALGGEVQGALHIMVKQSAEQNHSYTFTMSINTLCETRECGTAYARADDGVQYKCFLNLTQIVNDKWGWTNGSIGRGTYTWPIYLGAANCDISKGILAGELMLVYDGSKVNITYKMYEGFVMDYTHLYIGTEILPKDKKGIYTVAPGLYPYRHALAGATNDSYTINGFRRQNIYVIAHALVCYYR